MYGVVALSVGSPSRRAPKPADLASSASINAVPSIPVGQLHRLVMVRLLILPSEENDPGKPPTRVGFSAKTSIHKWFLMTFSKNPVFLRKVACQGGAHPGQHKGHEWRVPKHVRRYKRNRSGN